MDFDNSTFVAQKTQAIPTRGDAKSMCGKDLTCLIDRRKILDMHEQSGYTASVYVSVILTCYAIGMVILLLHFVKQKYGHVTLFDIYLELCSTCSSDGNFTANHEPFEGQEEDEDEHFDEEDHVEQFNTKKSSFKRIRFPFFGYLIKSDSLAGDEFENVRKSSSASFVDAKREGRDRRRRNKKKPQKHQQTNPVKSPAIDKCDGKCRPVCSHQQKVKAEKMLPVATTLHIQITHCASIEIGSRPTHNNSCTENGGTFPTDRENGTKTTKESESCVIKMDTISCEELLRLTPDDTKYPKKSTKETFL